MKAAIMSVDSHKKIDRRIKQLRGDFPLNVVIDTVSARMRAESGGDRYDLASNLVWLLSEAERDREVLQIHDEMIEQFPDDVRFPIGKAARYLYFSDDPEEALKCIDFALQRAYRTGFFRREALGVKARILLHLGRGEALSQVLEEIMSLQMRKDIPDVGRERDFVDRAPPGLISEDIVARYNVFRPKRATDTTLNEPPEYEHADDVG
jgi:hypothetical protein